MMKLPLFAAVTVLSASVALAAPFAPVGTDSTLPANSFGGSGIPTNDVMIATNGNGLTLGLSAHARYVGSLAYDNAGTFTAPAGSTVVAPWDTGLNGTWNFNFFIENTGGNGLAAFNYRLTLASDTLGPVYGNPLAIWDNAGVVGTSAGNSENPGFDFLGFTGYNPLVPGEYGVRLEAFSWTDTAYVSPVLQTAINIKVGRGSSVPDAGSTALMMGAALFAVAAFRRRLAA